MADPFDGLASEGGTQGAPRSFPQGVVSTASAATFGIPPANRVVQPGVNNSSSLLGYSGPHRQHGPPQQHTQHHGVMQPIGGGITSPALSGPMQNSTYATGFRSNNLPAMSSHVASEQQQHTVMSASSATAASVGQGPATAWGDTRYQNSNPYTFQSAGGGGGGGVLGGGMQGPTQPYSQQAHSATWNPYAARPHPPPSYLVNNSDMQLHQYHPQQYQHKHHQQQYQHQHQHQHQQQQPASPLHMSAAGPKTDIDATGGSVAAGSGGIAGMSSLKGSGSAEGAAWVPPKEQLHLYESMFAEASHGSAVPDTVSGRAAVQYFGRSGLPKDDLKTIWSLCDPSLTGGIGRPAFFAAMRLIALAQGSTPPSLPALEATAYTALPPPRMGSVASQPDHARDGSTPAFDSGATAGMVPSTLSVSPVMAPSTASSLDGVNGGAWVAPCGDSGGVGNIVRDTLDLGASLSVVSGAGSSTFSTGILLGSPQSAVGSPLSSMGAATKASETITAHVVSSDTLPMGAASTVRGNGEKEARSTADDRTEQSTKDTTIENKASEDDFGDFAGAVAEAAAWETRDGLPPLTPLPSFGAGGGENDRNVDDEDDDFGDFSSAPTDGETSRTSDAATTATTLMSTSSVAEGLPTAVTVMTPFGQDADDEWMKGGGTGGGAGVGVVGAGQRGAGLDDLIKTNLLAARTEPVHLADMQNTPSLLGKPHDPVMVDSASARQNKLSVFDAMADLDLAAGQEDWNDFADETTAPPRSSTPPPLAADTDTIGAGAAMAEDTISAVEGDAFAAAALASPVVQVAQANVEDSDVEGARRTAQGNDGSGASELFSPLPPLPRESTGVIDDTAGGQASAVATSADPWSSFGQAWEPAVGAAIGLSELSVDASTPISTPALVERREAPVAVGGDESQDDDWGDFEDAEGGGGGVTPESRIDGEGDAGAETPAAEGVAAGGAMSHDRGGENEGEWSGFMDVPASGTEGETAVADGADTPSSVSVLATPLQQSEDIDPFASISPPTPPPRPAHSPSPIPDDQGEHSGDGLVFDTEEGLGSSRQQEPQPGDSAVSTPGDETGENRAEPTSVKTDAIGTVDAGLVALHHLRDALASRERLEEAVEVQRRIDVQASSGRSQTAAAKAREKDIVESRDKDEEVMYQDTKEEGGGVGEDDDLDLDRWRSALELPPGVTVEELGERVASADAARGERFRERFHSQGSLVDGGVSGGGSPDSLATAVKRQRAALRAVSLSSVLGAGSAISRESERQSSDGTRDVERDEADVDLGMEMGGPRPPPCLSDWARMIAYVADTARQGLAALRGSGDLHGIGSAAVMTEADASDRSSNDRGIDCTISERGDDVGFDASDAGVGGEVARSLKFVTFSRGLREAVRVCRMLQAAAEDGLETIEGFAEMESAWEAFRRRAREARRRQAESSDVDDGDEDLFASDEEDEEVDVNQAGLTNAPLGKGNLKESHGRGGGGALRSVKAIRAAGIEEGSAESSLCAVSLQALELVSGGAEAPHVVEYCGVRYIASAVNLWLNVLDKAPPGPFSSGIPPK